MKKTHIVCAALLSVLPFSFSAYGNPAPANPSANADARARSDAEQEKKAAEWVGSLQLNDPAREARLREVIATHLKAVRDWHNEHPYTTVPAGINPVTGQPLSQLDRQVIANSAIPRSVHENLMAGLRKDLSEAQVEAILDKYTIGKVAFTMQGYRAIVPDLTKEEEATILGFLKQAREQAVDYKNMNQISAIFEIYKTKSEQYLNSNGRNWRQLYRAYTDAAKAQKAADARAARQMERLGRGVIAINQGDGRVYVGWRLLGTDPENVAFNLYRSTGNGAPVKRNLRPITDSTNFVDTGVDIRRSNAYHVRPVLDGREQAASAAFTLPANAPARNYVAIKLRGNYGFNKAGVGDLDGDGEYDYVIKQPDQVSDPGVYKPSTDTFKIEAYRGDGTFLWRKDLGWNIEQGIWWSPMLVYDLDGDGRAEVIAKTAPTDADYRGPNGKVASGPEWFSVFDGRTGKELARGDWIARGGVGDWGDERNNRASRHQMCIAYLDGKRPSLITFRGTYALMKAEAWNFRDGKLQKLWTWTNEGIERPGNLPAMYRGQGFHSIRVADIDGDGRDEIINGAMAISPEGKTLWATGEGHGDRFHVTDIDPDRPGLEIWYVQERSYLHPVHLRDARTGALLFGIPAASGEFTDVGRGLAADIDPRHRGLELWSAGGGTKWLFSAKGEVLATRPESTLPSTQFALWWDDDLLRELVEDGLITKWNYEKKTPEQIGSHVVERYSEKIVADIFGDWREEIVTVTNGEMRIYTTTIPSTRRFTTWMHDPVYRLDVSSSSSGYPQAAHPSFYFGAGMAKPPRPAITTAPSPADGRGVPDARPAAASREASTE